MNKGHTVVIAPNEDGLGTSAWAVRLIKEIARQRKDCVSKIRVVVATRRREDFHKSIFADSSNGPAIEIVKLNEGANKIELVKREGSTDALASIEAAILTYAESRREYRSELSRSNALEDADLVIDLGVPQLVRSVYSENLNRAAKSKKMVAAATVFDHAWSLSLRKIAFSIPLPEALTDKVEDALVDIENDEALAQEAIIFSEPISPLDYHGHWTKLLGRSPQVIRGALGGPLATLEYVDDQELSDLRVEIEAGGRCPEKAYDRARRYARELLGINNDLPALFVSGAGTSVWDKILKRMIDDYQINEPDYNVVIYSPAEVESRGIVLSQQERVEKALLGNRQRLIFIDKIAGETHHILFPAFDLVLTRAGGGTVNDAIACGAPLVLVEEPGMWQVEQIRQSCLGMHIAEGVTLREFVDHPRGCVESQMGRLKDLKDQRERIRSISNHNEIRLIEKLLRSFSDGLCDALK